jgi:hypothetical protein
VPCDGVLDPRSQRLPPDSVKPHILVLMLSKLQRIICGTIAFFVQQVFESMSALQVAPAQKRMALAVSLTIEENRQDASDEHLAFFVQQVNESLDAEQVAPAQ